MAYLKPKTLTCETCDFSARIQIVIGVGPNFKKGDTPYRNFRAPGPFTAEKTPDGKRTGRLLCPTDGTVVWENQRLQSADAPKGELK